MIFQDPYASLDPRWRAFDIIAEPIRAFDLIEGRTKIRARVGELSKGNAQRIQILSALAHQPELLGDVGLVSEGSTGKLATMWPAVATIRTFGLDLTR